MKEVRHEEFASYFTQHCAGKSAAEILMPEHIKKAASHGCVLLGTEFAATSVPSYNYEALLLPDNYPVCLDTGEKYGDHKCPVGQPKWLDLTDKGQFVIHEALFVRTFISYYGLKHISGAFYDQHGYIDDSEIQRRLYTCVEPFAAKGLSRLVNGLMEAAKAQAHYELGKPDESKVFISDGKVLHIDLKTGEYKCVDDSLSPTVNRLSVGYDPAADCPTFKAYLQDLFYEDDIPSLQEYMGYCLIPSTRGQSAMFIKGKGGEGKSILTYLMHELFGRSAVAETLAKLETSRFTLSTLENKLVFIDDDLNTESLKETGTLKKVITASTPHLVERKGQQAHDARLYARVFCLGNTHISAAFDRSDGFYRRLLLLTCKPIRKDRGNDKFLKERIVAELPGVFNWMLEGLQRLIKNNFEFTRSERALEEMEEKKLEDNPMLRFVLESGWLAATENGTISSRRLLASFRAWCELNAITEPAERTITVELRRILEEQAGAKHTKNVFADGVKSAGYKGVELTSEGLKHTFTGTAPIARAY
jgi:putative DNA primase/helicase